MKIGKLIGVFATSAVVVCLASRGWCAGYVVCSGVTAGDWKASSTWALSSSPSACSAGVPGTGDSVTITGIATITVSDNESFGLSNTTASDDCVIKSGGTLRIDSGGTLNAKGNLDLERGANFFVYGGTFSFVTPQAGTNYVTKFLNTGSGSNPMVRICAESTCTTAGTGNGVFTQVGPGTGALNAGANGYAPTLTANYATFSNLGSSKVYGINYSISNAVNPITLKNTLFTNNGNVLFNIGTSSNPILSADHLAFLNCRSTCVEFRGSAASASPRLLTNLSAYNAEYLGHTKAIYLNLYGAQLGKSAAAGDSSDVPGFSGYNVRLISGVKIPLIVRSSIVVEDQGVNGESCYLMSPNNGQLWQDQVCYSHLPNQHEWVGYGAVGPGSPNLGQRLFCDGDGYSFTDWGDFWQDQGESTLRDSLGINACGTLITAGISTARNTVLNNTIYQSYGATIGETGGSPNQVVAFRNNVITWPFGSNSGGVNAYSAFQRQASLSMDYNAFYGMPGSGDPIVCTQQGCPTTFAQPSGYSPLLPNPAVGSSVSYVRFPVAAITGLSAKSVTAVNGATVTCAACDFVGAGVQPGDFFVDNSLGAKPYSTIASVVDSTTLVLSSAISGCKAGHSFDVRPSYWSTPGWYYGDSHNGSHDLHINPNFVDTTRTMCTWLTSNGGYAPCGHTGNLTATAGTSTTSIVCSTCDFAGWGISSNDWIADYTSTGTFRAVVQVGSVVDAHTISVSPEVNGMTSSDHFSFITATRNLGMQIVAASGYDYLGNPVSFDDKWSVFSAMKFLSRGFAPQNPRLKGAGSPLDGSPDIGAVAVGKASSSHHPSNWRR